MNTPSLTRNVLENGQDEEKIYQHVYYRNIIGKLNYL